jgi:hypothetical protein
VRLIPNAIRLFVVVLSLTILCWESTQSPSTERSVNRRLTANGVYPWMDLFLLVDIHTFLDDLTTRLVSVQCRFADILAHVTLSEGTFLLTALANLARSSMTAFTREKGPLVDAICTEIFYISCIR